MWACPIKVELVKTGIKTNKIKVQPSFLSEKLSPYELQFRKLNIIRPSFLSSALNFSQESGSLIKMFYENTFFFLIVKKGRIHLLCTDWLNVSRLYIIESSFYTTGHKTSTKRWLVFNRRLFEQCCKLKTRLWRWLFDRKPSGCGPYVKSTVRYVSRVWSMKNKCLSHPQKLEKFVWVSVATQGKLHSAEHYKEIEKSNASKSRPFFPYIRFK